MKMITSTEWLLSFVIPEVMSSPEEQIATLKRTLSKLDTLPNALKEGVFLDTLRYMQSLDSGGMPALKEYILDALTVMELEGLLSLVEYAREQLKKPEYKKSATPSKGVGGIPSWMLPGGALSGSMAIDKDAELKFQEMLEKAMLLEKERANKEKKDLLYIPKPKNILRNN